MPPGRDLVAAGGSLEPDVVYQAYRHGIFPWYDAGEPLLWWSPEPRTILPLEAFHVPRRLARTLAQGRFTIRRDSAFEEIMRACDENRPDGSWIHADMLACYTELHRRGQAHSLEVFRDDKLVGGLYGVAFGGGSAADHGEETGPRPREVAAVPRGREGAAGG